MTYNLSAPAARSAWRSFAITRVGGAAVSWFLFSLCFTLLFLSGTAVIGLGGFCASGGPYQIAVQCPDAVAAFTPLSIFGGLIAVGLGAWLAQGFGTPLTTWAWPILFCGLGLAFLGGFVTQGDITGLLIGIMFEIMGLVPLVIELRGSPQRVFLGQFSASGAQFYEGESARGALLSPTSPNPDGAIKPTLGHWLAGLGTAVVFAALGAQVAILWFSALSTVPQ
ncbi:MAG: hypothetical protein ABI632_04170 [Pseudolysinimonas sp.]